MRSRPLEDLLLALTRRHFNVSRKSPPSMYSNGRYCEHFDPSTGSGHRKLSDHGGRVGHKRIVFLRQQKQIRLCMTKRQNFLIELLGLDHQCRKRKPSCIGKCSKRKIWVLGTRTPALGGNVRPIELRSSGGYSR